MAWSMHVTTGDQQGPRPVRSSTIGLDHKLFYLVTSLNTLRQASSRGAWPLPAGYLRYDLDYQCSNLVYQTHRSEGMQCSGDHTAWKVELKQTSDLLSIGTSNWPTMEIESLH